MYVKFPGTWGKEENPTSGTRIYSLNAFVDTLEENEYLRGIVVEAKLKWGRLLSQMDANKKATARLMSLLPNLKTLQLLPGNIYFTHTPSAQIISLHICTPHCETISMQHFESLLCNPFIRSLTITTVRSWTFHTEISEGTADLKDVALKSSILHLAIPSDICSADTMEMVLRAPKALVSLHYHYSGKVHPNHNAIMPSNFPTPLQPHQSSLEELVIYAQPHQHISLQHPTGNVMQTMQGFTALKRLGLPAWWMAYPSAERRDWQVTGALDQAKLVEMLPRGLEILQVQCEELRLNCRNQAPFVHHSRAENAIENYSVLLKWIKEIAEWKKDYVPALKKVIVWSSVARLLQENIVLSESGIEKAFLDQGVNISFIVCCPESPMLFGINANF